jgi:glucose/arabinose dehydrogenase
MLKRFVGTLIVTSILAAAAHAQAPQPQKPTAPTPAPTEASNVVRTPEPPGQAVNIKLDLTITDQTGPREPARRTITLIVADRAAGSIRSSGNNVRAVLNVDATPQILPTGNIKVQLGLEYNPRQAAEKEPLTGEAVSGGSSLNQRVSIVLVPGRPLMLSQAADPISDRKITVEVRADILK